MTPPHGSRAAFESSTSSMSTSTESSYQPPSASSAPANSSNAMERPTDSRNPFSRGSSPPSQFQPPNEIDALFSNLSMGSAPQSTVTAQQHVQQQQQQQHQEYYPQHQSQLQQQPIPNANQQSNSPGPGTPRSTATAGSLSSNVPNQQSMASHGALLSMLSQQSGPGSGSHPSQRANTPPTLPVRPGLSGSESQSKLLEQLMQGPNNSSNYPEQRPTAASHPAPPPDVDSYGTSYGPAPPPQAQPPSPTPSTRKSMFDFTSPFDALTPPSAPQTKKNPVTTHIPSSSEDSSSWTNISPSDPKRRSVENLMDVITRGQPMAPMTGPSYPHQQEPSYAETYGYTSQSDQETHYDTPQQDHNVAEPPHDISSQIPLKSQPQRGGGGSPIPSGNYPNVARDSREIPSATKGAQVKGTNTRGSQKSKGANQAPTFKPQNIVFDVAQPQYDIQAPEESVKSTAIALVKVEPTFLPGSTIGATHWVAYAMTRGRVRVISRSSGDRTLLQLPPNFPQSASVIDMSVYGNRLAGVTSDGGLVVWELPEVITDDVAGQLLMCVVPPGDSDVLHSVKWHPQDQELLAVASDSRIYLVNIRDAYNRFRGDSIAQSDMHQIGSTLQIPSPVIAFDFDLHNYALATISDDSTLSVWSLDNHTRLWYSQIQGDGIPSSLNFIDQGIVLGRQNGTIFQVLSSSGSGLLSTVSFVDSERDSQDMFGHVTYDRRINALWIANSRRESVIALKATVNADGQFQFGQIVEFTGPRPTIHFVILTAEADPTGEEAHAACVAAKMPPGELALVAFCVHASGVDQVLIRKEWYDHALASTTSKLPSNDAAVSGLAQQIDAKRAPPAAQTSNNPSAAIAKTPPSEDVEVDVREDSRQVEPKNKSSRNKSVVWKDKDDSSGREKDGKAKGKDITDLVGDSAALTKEIRKVEESLHSRIGKLISKELDKQHHRMEELRAAEQAADFNRQEKLLKMISNELTKNTTRVVESAVRSEVQNSVLPSLEQITKTEVKSALNGQITKGLGDSMKQTLPNEIERLLLRPDVSNHVARTFSAAVLPIIERQVKDSIHKILIPAYQEQSHSMFQDLCRQIHNEILDVKKEVVEWQSRALAEQESIIRDMERNIRSLSDQVKSIGQMLVNSGTYNTRGPTMPQSSNAPSSPPQIAPQHLLKPSHGPSATPPNYAPPWSYSSNHLSRPIPPSTVSTSSQSNLVTPSSPESAPTEEWDDTYLRVLTEQSPQQLRELLQRSNPDTVMPLNSPGPLSQAVVLTLVHRLSSIVNETPPVDETFKPTLWWLQRAATVLNVSNPMIAPYVGRVLPNVQHALNTTKQRLALLPGGPPLIEINRTLTEIQNTLGRS